VPTSNIIRVPGRVNLIGEHIDYHQLPVLPVAIQRHIAIEFRPRADLRIHAVSADPRFGPREFDAMADLRPSPPGDWENYIKAAAQAIATKWTLTRGIDAEVTSDLPPAAGLSSSSALLTAFTLALLQANDIPATFEELMDILPEGEHFVGTRGGGMDHAAVLAARAGSALVVRFDPITTEDVPIPEDWALIAAHSLVTAEKSGAVRAEYNARRTSGTNALERLGFTDYRQVVAIRSAEELEEAASELQGDERSAFLHVTLEALRVNDAVAALRAADAEAFGRVLNASHDSARDLLRISCPELDRLVDIARSAGALGARLTGAGFGGFAVIACLAADRERIAAEIESRFYAGAKDYDPAVHLIHVQPSAGALHA
jgi:galactokinase